jgi:KDO2-lipid IV(A) lauroyltransferase
VKPQKRVKRELTYWLFRALAAPMAILPRGFALCLGSVAGIAGYVLLREARADALHHLELAYPHADRAWRKRIVVACFRHLAWNAADFLYFTTRDPLKLAAVVEVAGRENLDGALQEGRGVLCFTGHVGNWELLGAYLACRGYRLAVVARRLYYPKLDRWVNSLRERMGSNVINRNDPPSTILSWLRDGSVIGVLVDQDTRTRGVFVDFFGRSAYTPAGPALLAMRARAPLVPIFMKRVPGHTYRVVIGTPRRGGTGPPRQQSLELTRWATMNVEQAIREDPPQWIWMHRRWRTKP